MNCRTNVLSFIFFIVYQLITQNTYAQDNLNYDLNVWDVLRKDFAINHETSRPEVQRQIKWLTNHPEYIQKLAKSEPYIYYIMSEVKKYNIPGELALIPMIESAFNPFAYSQVGASGLWQIMPRTGRELGLRQTWWYDSRRSINSSTKAALSYLKRLHNMFSGNWILAIAAYDVGEGAIARSIKRAKSNSKNVHFWSLNLPNETKAYIPKILALAEVIENPQKYHIKLPQIPHKPYFKEIDIGSQIDLGNAAKLAGISYQSLIKLNPEYNRSATSPGTVHKLLIPVHKIEYFKKNLANLPQDRRITWSIYKINPSDDIQKVAKKYNTNAKFIKEINKLKTTSIKNQQFLLVPKKQNETKDNSFFVQNDSNYNSLQQYKVVHVISNNDTYSSLQTKYNVSNEELIKWNEKLALTGRLLPGQSIVIWKNIQGSYQYIVKSGDNLGKIASNNNLKVSKIIELNPELEKNKIKPGQIIKLS